MITVPIYEAAPAARSAISTDVALTQPVEAAAATLASVSIASAAEKEKAKPTRGTTVKLSVPLDEAASTSARSGTTTTVHGTRKLLRRDSLERREALLKGKEGSRQRRRWENDRLLNNPHAEPPLPSDWEVRPTYPRRTVPYYLAPLWDAAEFQRAIEAKLKGSRRSSVRTRRYGKTGANVYNAGMSPMEEAASNIPKEIRARLKHARSAKGLLMDLEDDVRKFVRVWNERELRLRDEGLADAPLPKSKVMPPSSEKTQGKKKSKRADGDSAIMSEEEEEDEEIVFVGRNGAMLDMPTSPTRSLAHSMHVDGDEDHQMVDKPVDDIDAIIATEKCIFQSASTDASAGFARWLVHCVGSYYGLRTWSVTRTVEGESRREAYVGVDSRARGWMGAGRCIDLDGRKEVELPMPLYGMV